MSWLARSTVSDYRFLVDDASLGVAELTDAELESVFDRFSDELQARREAGELVGVISNYDVIECRPGMLLHELLTGDNLPRDCRVRAYGLLDKCGRFDSDPAFVIEPQIDVDGVWIESFAVASIAELRRINRAVGALALVPRYGPGRVTVTDEVGAVEAFVVVDADTRVAFYRSIFAIENTPEALFIELAIRAFPRLRFVDGLTFRRFEGSYSDLREAVVEHLGALNDRFVEAFVRLHGLTDQVAAAVGIDLSIEGNTRQSERLMRERDVEYAGRSYRCEWHSKLEPHRNRIHVHPGDANTDGCVLIGIFVDHLPT